MWKAAVQKRKIYLLFSAVCAVRLPFHSLNDDHFLLTTKGIEKYEKNALELLPSFSIKTLLDKLPGNVTIQTGDFTSDTITSKYYTPFEFLESNLSKHGFSVLHINIASLQAHIDDLKQLLVLLNYSFDVIGISETKLKVNVKPSTNIEIDGYNLENTPTQTHFGGVALYVKKCYDSKLRTDLSSSVEQMAESVFIEIEQNRSKNILIGCFYRHHTPLSDFNDSFLKNVLNKISKEKSKTCILLGDWNANLLDYDNHEATEDFYELLSSYSFQPLILQPSRVTARSATLIDNIFVNDLAVSSTGGNIVTSISDHYPQFSLLDILKKDKEIPKSYKKRSYKNFNHREFRSELLNINWTKLFENKSSEDSFNAFIKEIDKLLDEMAPIKVLTNKESKSEGKPWITTGILKSIHDRDKLHKRYLKETNKDRKAALFHKFKTKRNIITLLLRRSKADYYANYFAKNKTNIKETWKGIKKLINLNSKSKSNINKIKTSNGYATDKKDIATEFNDFFSTVGSKIDNKTPKTNKIFTDYLKEKNDRNQLFLKAIESHEVLNLINQLVDTKACGPSSIPNKLLKEHKEIFSNLLTTLINKSFSDGTFPEMLKLANLTPIHKKKAHCNNYRPISLLSNISKIYEKAYHVQIYEFLEDNNVIYDLQFGFRKKHSTDHALLSITENIKNKLDNNTFTCGVFIDLEKAFDTVNHKILLKKLEYYGINGIAKCWLTDYLTNRKQRVKIENEFSDYKSITCGVPQGSILGPLLFLIYINDMHQVTKYSTLYHFADDTNLLYSHKDIRKLRKAVNSDLKLVFQWLCANRLSLNIDKTEFIVFKSPRKSINERITLKLNGKNIFESKKLRYLGLIVDSHMTWKYHISELRKKLGQIIGIIFNLKKIKAPLHTLRSVYFALFQSYMCYGLCVWGQTKKSNFNKIEMMQKKVIRLITDANYDAETNSLFKNVKILKLKDQLQLKNASLMWDYDHVQLPKNFTNYFTYANETHGYLTRFSSQGKLCENKQSKTDTYGVNSFMHQGPKILNSLKTLEIYKEAKTRVYFLNKYKQSILDSY